MTTPAEHTRAWVTAYALLEKHSSQLDPEELEARAEMGLLKILCASVAAGYEAVAKEQENDK